MTDQVQVTLDRSNLERFIAHADYAASFMRLPAPVEPITAELRAALTQPQEGQEVEEQYRVVGENFRGEPYKTTIRDLGTAMANLRGWKSGGALNGRIQHRTVTYTPWTDLPDHSEDEEGRG